MNNRLDKLIASHGFGTRSRVGAMIRGGRVTVDGTIIRDTAFKLDPELKTVAIDGSKMVYRPHIYIMMNKPAGLLSVSRDNRAETVISRLPGTLCRPGLFPAGRLDKDTTGLLIITDDGVFGHNLTSPGKGVVKTYHAMLDAPVTHADIDAFAEGIVLEDGTKCRSASLKVIQSGQTPMVEICITEGRYHQIKRMAAAVGKMVLLLKRVAIGRLFLDNTLPNGGCRELTDTEVSLLFENV